MKLLAVPGLNNKNYIQVITETLDDLKTLKQIDGIVSRTEYLPYSRGFNKNVRQSYLIDNTYVPFQFAQDIIKNLQPLVPWKVSINGDGIFYNNNLTRQHFNDYMEALQLPEKYDIFDANYFYQMEAAYRAILFKTARIMVGTGGGKTLITYLYCRYIMDTYVPAGRKILIIVPRKTLAVQLAKDFKEYDQFNDIPLLVETIYSGSKRIANANIVVGTYQTLCEYDKEYFDDFYSVICDEVHGAKAYSIRNGIYAKCYNTEYFFGMTGSFPEYATLDYINIVAMFGPQVLVKKTWELIRDGNATPVKINRVVINYPDDERDMSKNLRAEGFTGTEKYHLEKRWFQNHLRRNMLMCKLINGHRDLNHLVLVETVDYCKFLKIFFEEHCPDWVVHIIHGGIKDRDDILDEMRGRDDMILIATYECMSTGVSVATIGHVHFPDGGRSEVRIKQSVGRSLRIYLKKLFANVWDYQDMMPGSSFKNHAAARNLIYEKEKLPVVEYIVNLIKAA
jgi:superfamily II DNA or RNA helicase